MATSRCSTMRSISIHALHEESDPSIRSIKQNASTISIHALHEESDCLNRWNLKDSIFQSTLSMRRATDYINHNYTGRTISIHALHEESDLRVRITCGDWLISIHALHEESDRYDAACPSAHPEFQSTLSMRRATTRHHHWTTDISISIHALHEESDPWIPIFFSLTIKFQSTLSMRRATRQSGILQQGYEHFNPRSP